MRELDADRVPVSVAHVPAKAVLRDSVIYRATVQLHNVMHCIGIVARPQQRVVVGARAGVRRLMDDEIARIEVTVPVGYVPVDALVCLGTGGHRKCDREREEEKRGESRAFLPLDAVCLHVARPPWS